MDAYTLVEPPLRAKFEELLATWKEPPPAGSTMSPVFPIEVTRKIENALLKAKSVGRELEQRRQREMAASGLLQHRRTPPARYGQMVNGNAVRHFIPSAYRLQNVNVYPRPQAGPSNQDILLDEIRNLLTNVTHAVLLNPSDDAARTKLGALNQLQNILQTATLPYDQIEQVRHQLAALAIQQQRQQLTATPPIGQQDRTADTLMQSLRAVGLLGASAPMTNMIPTPQPLSVNSSAVNLRNSDLELTSSSLQKYLPSHRD